jgi:beta-mannosidase
MAFLSACQPNFIKPVLEITPASNWRLTNVTDDTTNQISIDKANVPGFVQLDIWKNFPDPQLKKHLGVDSLGSLDFVSAQSWNYEYQLSIPDSLLSYRAVDLVFEGIDTHGEIYLNDSLLGRTDNMFRSWRIPIRKHVKPGQNKLNLMLHPPMAYAIQYRNRAAYTLPASDPVQPMVSPFIRKAPYQFGWDWSPRCLSMGIWKPVRLEAYDGIAIRSVHITTKEIASDMAWMYATVEMQASHPIKNLVLKVGDSFRQFSLTGNDTLLQVPFKISNPRQWWPNGHGEQHLYDIIVHAFADGYLVDSALVRTGIRTTELVMEKDSVGTSFYFLINGKKIFAQGANYVPQGLFPGTEPDGKRIQLLKDAASVGMNMLRVWGGGIYEDDRFYEICDSLGIMVWQDFMFACAMYPIEKDFIDNVQEEVTQQVKRLRNHPCLVLWCGNNESDVAWKNWGWQKQYGISSEDSTRIRNGYVKLFQDRIPTVLMELDPGKPYIHSSPLSNWGKRENFNHLNMHYWGVWHGEEAIDSFKVNIPRFMAEFGMQSLPSYEKLLAANGNVDPEWEGEFINSRQKSYKGNRLLVRYIEDRYGSLSSIRELSYLSQIHQAEAMSMAIGSHRLNAGQCMGSLYWQLNDVWDGASWSTIEANGDWKAAHYALKRLFAPIIGITEFKNDTVHISIQNSTGKAMEVMVAWTCMDLSGKVISNGATTMESNGLLSEKAIAIPWSGMASGYEKGDLVFRTEVSSVGTVKYESFEFLTLPKDLKLKKPQINCRLVEYSEAEQTSSIEISTDQFAYGLHISTDKPNVRFSENYFHLTPGIPRTIMVSTENKLGCESLSFKSYSPSDR